MSLTQEAPVSSGCESKSDWRDYLTSRERSDLEALEKNAQRLDGQRRRITAEITLYRGRCIQRRRSAMAKRSKVGDKA